MRQPLTRQKKSRRACGHAKGRLSSLEPLLSQMHAMQIGAPGSPLRMIKRPVPVAGFGELMIEVSACGVCRTDLHIVDGEIAANYPIVPGHEIVGFVHSIDASVCGFSVGQRVGVPWLGSTCGVCLYCLADRENLCDRPEFTECTRDGGYASHVVANAQYCFAISDCFSDLEAAPLLCAGLIGWRALRLAGDGQRIGLYGFGASAHILAQIAAWQGRDVYAFTKAGDVESQAFALSLGCVWAGASDELPPTLPDAAIIFAPDGALVPAGLKAVRKGGRVVCAGIHMSNIPAFPYADLWGEREILSVANLTREDGTSLFAVAEVAGIKTVTERFALGDANIALERLRSGALRGAAVLIMARTPHSPDLTPVDHGQLAVE